MFDQSIASGLMQTTIDLYNQNLAGKPSGTVNLNVNCADGGTAAISGTVTTPGDSGLTTVNLTFVMDACYAIHSHPVGGGTSSSSIRTTGTITKTASFSKTSYGAIYESSGNLALSGTLHITINSVTHLDPTIDESCALTASWDGAHVKGSYCARLFSW